MNGLTSKLLTHPMKDITNKLYNDQTSLKVLRSSLLRVQFERGGEYVCVCVCVCVSMCVVCERERERRRTWQRADIP